MIRMLLVFISILSFKVCSQKLPEWNSEYKRWHIPADEWNAFTDGNYTMKNKYLQISFADVTSSLKFYNSEKLEKLMFEIRNFDLSINSVPACGIQSIHEEFGNDLVECKFFYCEKTKINKKFIIPYITKDFTRLNSDQECPMKPQIILSSENGRDYYNVPLQDELKDPTFIKVKDSKTGDYSFLDLSFCKQGKSLCKVVTLKESLFEATLKTIDEHKKRKDLIPILELSQNLKPCLMKNDVNCIRQYFITEDEFHSTSNDYVISKELKFPKLIIDKKLINELIACLDHERLLIATPTLLTTKGINKVCVFSTLNHTPPPKGKSKMLTVVYPEGVRMESDSSRWLRED